MSNGAVLLGKSNPSDWSDAVIGIDVGGTNVRAGVVTASGQILDQRRITARLSDCTGGAREVADLIFGLIKPLLAQQPCRAVGVGFPGFILRGCVVASPNIPAITNAPLAELLADRCELPTAIDNDAACAALGEFTFGAGGGGQSLLHLTLGTGVGAGVILNGQIYAGDHGMSLEAGHLTVEPRNGRPCGCTRLGCLEGYASARALQLRYQEEAGVLLESDEICLRAGTGDALAARLVFEAASYLGYAIAQIENLFDIEKVTIGGGLSAAWPQLHGPLEEALRANLIPPLRSRVTVVPARLGDDAGILGAASLAFGML